MDRKLSILPIVMLICQLLALPALAEKKVALVLGNSAYTVIDPLDNPSNDAEAIAVKLGKIGFEVFFDINLTYADSSNLIDKFIDALEGTDIALLYYAGHALQVKGNNYLLPVDAVIQAERDLSNRTITLGSVLLRMSEKATHVVAILDACRENPFQAALLEQRQLRYAERSLSASGRTAAPPSEVKESYQGLAQENFGGGSSYILYSAEPGTVAYDSAGGRHSPFTESLLKYIDVPGLLLPLLTAKVRNEVSAKYNDQRPMGDSKLLVNISLAGLAPEDGLTDGDLLQPRSADIVDELTRNIQTDLIARGCYDARIADGVFGNNTKFAAAKFRSRAKLPKRALTGSVSLVELEQLQRQLTSYSDIKCPIATKPKEPRLAERVVPKSSHGIMEKDEKPVAPQIAEAPCIYFGGKCNR